MALRILGQNGGATIKELFVSPHAYSLAQAIYDAPFYWMVQDEAYLPTLTKNRGDFTGNFVAERLRTVFGAEHVHLNVDIFESKAAAVAT